MTSTIYEKEKQFNAIEVDSGCRLSHVKIHVERIVGMVKQKYTILQSAMPTCLVSCDETSVPAIDKIVLVCSALCNCCDAIFLLIDCSLHINILQLCV